MRTVVRTVVLFGVMLLAAGVIAQAQAPTGGGMQHQGMGQGTGRGMGMHGAGPMGALAQLNLTDQQKQQVHQLLNDEQLSAKRQADMQQMEALHEQLKAQVFADAGPTGKESAIAQQISELQAKMIQDHIVLADKLSGILTADQRKQLREMPMGDLMGMMGMGMGHGPAPGGPPKK